MRVPPIPGALYNYLVQEELLFGKIAVEEGFVSQTQLDLAMNESNGKTLTDILVDRGILRPEQIQIIRDIQRIHMAEITAPAEPVSEAFMDSCATVGVPRVLDINGSDDARTGYTQFSTRRGTRVTAAGAFLRPALRRDHVTLMTRAEGAAIRLRATEFR